MARGFAIWLTGLSGAGKSTIAQRLERELETRGRGVEVLDGDAVRMRLSKGLGYSREDRDANVLRIAFVASLLVRHDAVVIAAAIAPYAEARRQARETIGADAFVEVHVHCSIEELTRRDVKGLYARALRGELANFTGVSDPYEAPESPAVRVDTERETVEESVGKILSYLEEHGYIDREAGRRGGKGVGSGPARDAPRDDRPRPLLEGSMSEDLSTTERGHDAEWAPIPPHGGRLVDRLVRGAEGEELRRRASELPSMRLSARQLNDLESIAAGTLSPLTGFMGRADYERVVEDMRLESGLPWTIPVTLAVEAAVAPTERTEIALRGPDGELRGVMRVDEVFSYDRRREARAVYRTEEEAHPGVAALYAQGDTLLGGPVTALPFTSPWSRYLTPAETRAAFAARGWRTVVGFQTRNPVHRAHEYIQKCALETVDGLLLHPLVGETKADDIPADVRMRCYEVLLERYYPRERVILSALPAAMRYAGPREAVFHAIMRKNHGCTHFIVGRDHAGVGSYYGPYDAQTIFDRFDPAALGIVPLKFENSFYCRRCAGMATARTCPHPAEHHVELSGARVRALLRAGEAPPPEFSRPEVAAILIETMRAGGARTGTGTGTGTRTGTGTGTGTGTEGSAM